MEGNQEQRALRLSAWGNVVFAALGLGFGLATNSEAIMLDGYFSLIAFVMSLLTLKVSRLVAQGEDEVFHFGYNSFEPFLNTIKGLFILALCAVALVSAIVALFRGGREISLGWAVIYSVVAMTGALTLALIQSRVARQTDSPLLDVDARNWRIDGILSGAVLLAFLTAIWIRNTQWSHLLPYVDPALVAVLIIAVVREPIRIVRDGIGELLYISPPPEVQHQVRQRFDELVAGYGFRRSHLRMVKVGRVSYLAAHIVVPTDFKIDNIDQLDEIRHKIADGIRELHPSWTVDTTFVADETLVGD